MGGGPPQALRESRRVQVAVLGHVDPAVVDVEAQRLPWLQLQAVGHGAPLRALLAAVVVDAVEIVEHGLGVRLLSALGDGTCSLIVVQRVGPVQTVGSGHSVLGSYLPAVLAFAYDVQHQFLAEHRAVFNVKINIHRLWFLIFCFKSTNNINNVYTQSWANGKKWCANVCANYAIHSLFRLFRCKENFGRHEHLK